MASQSQVCRWLLVTTVAFLSMIPTAKAQTTDPLPTVVTIETLGTTTSEIASTAMRTEGVSTTSGECEDCTDEPEEPGLSPGAIAGIVIGSVAGVAIIGGGIGYAICHAKAPAKVTPTTDIEIQDMSDSPEANSDQAKLTNASDTHKDGND